VYTVAPVGGTSSAPFPSVTSTYTLDVPNDSACARDVRTGLRSSSTPAESRITSWTMLVPTPGSASSTRTFMPFAYAPGPVAFTTRLTPGVLCRSGMLIVACAAAGPTTRDVVTSVTPHRNATSTGSNSVPVVVNPPNHDCHSFVELTVTVRFVGPLRLVPTTMSLPVLGGPDLGGGLSSTRTVVLRMSAIPSLLLAGARARIGAGLGCAGHQPGVDELADLRRDLSVHGLARDCDAATTDVLRGRCGADEPLETRHRSSWWGRGEAGGERRGGGPVRSA
jgi:hypothetical protein